MKLPSRQPRALQQGARLVHIRPDIHAPLRGQHQRTEPCAVFRGRQRSGVAVGQYGIALMQEREPRLRDGAAHGDILRVDRHRLRPQGGHDPSRAAIPAGVGGPAHALDLTGKIHRRRPAGDQIAAVLVEPPEKVILPVSPGKDVHRVRRKNADRRRAAHTQGADRLVKLLAPAKLKIHELAGKPGLVNNAHRAAGIGQRDVLGLFFTHIASISGMTAVTSAENRGPIRLPASMTS